MRRGKRVEGKGGGMSTELVQSWENCRVWVNETCEEIRWIRRSPKLDVQMAKKRKQDGRRW